jgi:hypothetical protein
MKKLVTNVLVGVLSLSYAIFVFPAILDASPPSESLVGEYSLFVSRYPSFYSGAHPIGAVNTSHAAMVTVWIDAPYEVPEAGYFTATVNISEVEEFDVAEVDVLYDPAVLQVTDVTRGKIGTAYIHAGGVINPKGVQGKAIIMGFAGGPTGVNGSGHIARIHFHVIGSSGQTSSISFSDGMVGDIGAQSIPAKWTGDSVRVGPASASAPSPAVPTATPTRPSPATTTTVSIRASDEVSEGSILVATVDISYVSDFDTAQFDVVYDPEVLEVVEITDGLIGSTVIPVAMWGFIPPEPPGTQGRARVLNNVPGVPGVNGSGCLAEIHFRVVGSSGETSRIDLAGHSGPPLKFKLILGNNRAQDIPANWVNDSVRVVSP